MKRVHILLGLSIGISVGFILYEIQTLLHFWHSGFTGDFAGFITFLIMIPTLEEISKKAGSRLNEKLSGEKNIFYVLAVAYGFQIVEATHKINTERDFYIRFILPLHLLFTMVSVRRSLAEGIALHFLWNIQLYLPQSSLIQGLFIFVSYVLFILIFLKIRKEEKDKIKVAHATLLKAKENRILESNLFT